ncbi:MAG: bifunctional glutamate N-acetyltransferase/amino-acid acetyltransferase ArgJ [Thermodesulfobacteriota bacterium]|nr:bifunctional glutamate N-acetyltransferase/amino-acid acetyltransferase ArgJ [Thermodesulfobacteriota bacterium]
MKKENNSKKFIVPGFLANGISSGIKKNKEKDLALIYTETPSTAMAVFTMNKVKAAPVLVSMERAKANLCRAIIVNSGNANACTGKEGMNHAYSMTRLIAENLDIDENMVLVASTGVIGKKLPMDTISSTIPRLVKELTSDGIYSAAEAIMTTDTFPKVVLRKGTIGGKEVTLCGMAKGSGMIMPNMATMLSFVLTDVDIEADALEMVFQENVKHSFNAISVDGETSTNDMAVILASGRAENPTIRKSSEELVFFKDLLMEVLVELAQMIVRDGEGATKFVEVSIVNAREPDDAKRAAFSVANSNLVKTAFFGEDCNWGRIVSAIGASGIHMNPDTVNISFDDILVVKNGISAGEEMEERAQDVLQRKEFKVEIDLNCGSSKARVYTSDLSLEYININANYRT